MIAADQRSFQIPLIEFVESDDLYLQRQEDILWFGLLRDLDWRCLRPVVAQYYEALWQFNVRQAQMRRERGAVQAANPETSADATRRLLFQRATLCEDTPALYELPASAPPQIHVDPQPSPQKVAPEDHEGLPLRGPRALPTSLDQRRRRRRHRGQVQRQDVLGPQGLDLGLSRPAGALGRRAPERCRLARLGKPRPAPGAAVPVPSRPPDRHRSRARRRVTPTGTPVCQAGYPFDFLGCRHDTQRFLFRAPEDAQGVPVCQGCPLRPECYRGADGGRQITVPFARLPWIDPQFPQLSRRFARAMAHRTAIERLHKLMKFDYGDARLSKRGNAAFQARLDKTLLAMHLILAHA